MTEAEHPEDQQRNEEAQPPAEEQPSPQAEEPAPPATPQAEQPAEAEEPAAPATPQAEEPSQAEEPAAPATPQAEQPAEAEEPAPAQASEPAGEPAPAAPQAADEPATSKIHPAVSAITARAATMDGSEVDQRNREVYDENLEIIYKAWSNDLLQHDGKHYQIPYPYSGIEGWPNPDWTRELGSPGEIDVGVDESREFRFQAASGHDS